MSRDEPLSVVGPDPAISGWRDYINDPSFNPGDSARRRPDKVLFWRDERPALWAVDYNNYGGPTFFDAQGEREDYDYKRPPKTKVGIAAYIVKFLTSFAGPDKVLDGRWFLRDGISREFRQEVLFRL